MRSWQRCQSTLSNTEIKEDMIIKFAFVLFIAIMANPAFAAEFFLTPDRGGVKNQVVNDGDTLKVYLQGGRSYECFIEQQSYQSGDPFFGFAETFDSPTGSAPFFGGPVLGAKFAFAGTSHPVFPSPDDSSLDPDFKTDQPELFRSSRSRVILIPDTSGFYRIGLEDRLNTDGSSSLDIRCGTTTLVGKYNRFQCRNNNCRNNYDWSNRQFRFISCQRN